MDKSALDKLAVLLVNAFDIDIELFYTKLLQDVKGTEWGMEIASFAERNPTTFKNILRGVSAVAQTMPRDHFAMAEASEHIARAAVEAQKIFGPNNQSVKLDGTSQGSNSFDLNNKEFLSRYEEALQGLTDEELQIVAGLSDDKLSMWVLSPKPIRGHLLKKMTKPSLIDENLDDLEKLSKKLLEKSQVYYMQSKGEGNDK